MRSRVLDIAGLILAAACGASKSTEACVIPPCLPPTALNVTLVSAAAPVTGSLAITGGDAALACAGSCRVFGNAGAYHVKATAPGFRSAEVDVTVNGTYPECGCPNIETKNVTITLAPA
jgi:hypothetical protein